MPGRLRVRRPSPTTVSFAVSDAPSRSNSSAKILFALQILLRSLVFCCAIFAAIARFRHSYFTGNDSIIHWEDVWSNPLGLKVCRWVDPYNPWAVAATSALAIYGVFRKGYTGASLSDRIAVQLLTLCCRGIPPCHPRLRDSDFYLVLYISVDRGDEVHPNHPDSGYCDP